MKKIKKIRISRERRLRNKALRNKGAERPRRHKKNRLQPWQAPKMKMFSMPQLLAADVPREKRLEILRSIGTKAKANFSEKYPKVIEAWFKDYDPIYLLSFCAFYFVAHQEGVDPEATGEMDFYHHYLEIMQAVALCGQRNFDLKPLLQESERLQKEIKEIGDLIGLRLLNIPSHLKTDEEISAYRLRTEMMSHTAAIRNWAYFHQMKRVALDLARVIAPQFKEVYSIDPLDFINAFLIMTDERTELLNTHRDKIRSCMKKSNYKEVIEAYNQTFPEHKPIENEEVELMWDAARKNKNNLVSMLICHADLRLEEIYSFTFEHLQSFFPDSTNAEALKNFIEKLSLKFGDLNDSNKEYLILDNPIHRKPFIKIDENTYYSAIWGILPHLLLDILEDLIWEHPGLREKYTNARSKYLEDEVEKIFRKHFPSAEIHRGSLWGDFENDLTVIIDSFAIVVEAKSGTITDPAKRGAPDRFFETLKRLIEEPSEQALRFIDYLKADKKNHAFTTKSGGANNIDSSKIKYYIPLGVTLAHLGMISSNLKKLIEAKVVDKTIEQLAPSINLTDLECIFELLPLEPQKVHYLARRREIEAHLEYEGDELDLLAFYLDNGFNIGDVEYKKEMAFNIGLKSKELDMYFVGINEGKNVSKPEVFMTQWWQDLLVTICKRNFEGWIETAFVLLNTTKEDQEKFESGLQKLIHQIEKGRISKPHNWVVFLSGPERRRYAIIGYPYKNLNKETRDDIMHEALEEGKVEKSRGAVVIGINIDHSDYPYSVLARRLSTDLFDTLSL